MDNNLTNKDAIDKFALENAANLASDIIEEDDTFEYITSDNLSPDFDKSIDSIIGSELEKSEEVKSTHNQATKNTTQVSAPKSKESQKSSKKAKSVNNDKTSESVGSDQIGEVQLAEPRDSYQVLVIDDDKWIRKIFQQNIQSWGFEFLEAEDSITGLQMAMDKDPLVIFLDVVLPDVYGDITLKFIKGLESSKKPPVVIISGNLNKNLLRQTYKDGAVGFITKPFTKETLKDKLLSVIDKSVLARMKHDNKLTDVSIV